MLFVPMAERLMIQTHRPLWNVRIDGFGNHDPGGSRYDQERFPWDTLHPGRYWAPRLAEPSYTAAELRTQARAHLNEHPGTGPGAASRPRRAGDRARAGRRRKSVLADGPARGLALMSRQRVEAANWSAMCVRAP